VKLIKNNNNQITEFEVSGHSNSNEFGEDVICSGVSSITQTAALGLLSVAAINIKMKRDDGYLKVTLPNSLTSEQMHDADIILSTMMAGVYDLYSVYSDFIEING
jgi:uncharacterized protein YsxB (DUF464 family)